MLALERTVQAIVRLELKLRLKVVNSLELTVPARLKQFDNFNSELGASRIYAAVQDALAGVNEEHFVDFLVKLHDHLAN